MMDVLIIGCGPTGAVLSLLLAKCGLNVTVIEKEQEVFAVPRATHIDEETLRNFQLTGLMGELAKHTESFGFMEMVSETGKHLFEEEIKQLQSEHGYIGSRFFDQPAFERVLRASIQQTPHITLITGAEVIGLMQDGESVIIEAKVNNETVKHKAKYAVGCDGGRSTIRQLLGIDMYALEPAREWVIVDSLLKNEADKPLLPSRFQYIFNKKHLTIYAHGFGINRRWEFQLNIGETQPPDEVIKQWVANYIDLGKIEITRIAKYAHNSLVAHKWRNKRVFLAGDAAHMMPPSAGQGLCSGVRDAVNLAWKLNEVIRDKAPTTLLDTYEGERKPHLHQILKRTLFIGKQLQAKGAFGQWIRSLRVQAINNITPLKNYLRKRYNTPPPLNIEGVTTPLSGTFLPQTGNSDDVIGYRFALVVKPGTLTEQQLHQAANAGMVIIDDTYSQWLDKHTIDFAIVRPDKIITLAGKAGELKEYAYRFGNKL